MGTVNAGQFRRRIAIQSEVHTPNASGGYALTWSNLPGCDSVPAKIVYAVPSKKGDEKLANGQVQASVFMNITIRYRPSQNIDASNQIVYGSRLFNIRTIYPIDEAQQTITMQCEELQSKGTLHS